MGSFKSETVKYGREFQGNPRKTELARASSIYKRQTRLLVREGDPQEQDRNCQTAIHIWSCGPDGARHQDLLTDRQWHCDFDFDFQDISSVRHSS
jgi:hypothetical protein